MEGAKVGDSAEPKTLIPVRFPVMWNNHGQSTSLAGSRLILHFPVKKSGSGAYVAESQSCFYIPGVKSLAVILNRQENMLRIGLQFYTDMRGLGMPDDIADFFLDNPCLLYTSRCV